jgi:prepilin-type N-terminal cleavage/methylation domain-containing protein
MMTMLRAHPRRRSAFTLIEMMIALVLGSAILYTTLAGMRVASQCYTIATRLSLENALIRAGFMKALDEVDFWTAYDDPTDPSLAFGGVNGGEVNRNPGLPFCPFANAPANFKPGGLPPMPNPDGTYPPIDGSLPPTNEAGLTGWNPTYNWSMSDPAVWTRANMGARGNNGNDMRFGYYGMFSGTYGQFPSGTSGLYYHYGAVTVPHQWLANQMDGLKNTLGYYGMIDYLPANTIFSYNCYKTANGQNADAVPYEFSYPAGPYTVNVFGDADGGTQVPRGLYRDTKDVSIALLPLRPQGASGAGNQATPVSSVSQAAAFLRQDYYTGQEATPANLSYFQDLTTSKSNLMGAQPANWPLVGTSVARYITADRYATVCRIGWISPTTGEHVDLSFTAFGTSLRGARQQRAQAPGGGWAQWDNGGAANASNLDTQ